MSLHGTTGNEVSKSATPQGSATAHTLGTCLNPKVVPV